MNQDIGPSYQPKRQGACYLPHKASVGKFCLERGFEGAITYDHDLCARDGRGRG